MNKEANKNSLESKKSGCWFVGFPSLLFMFVNGRCRRSFKGRKNLIGGCLSTSQKGSCEWLTWATH